MPGPIYSSRLFAIHDAPAFINQEYTVPALQTLVVRCIDLYYGGSLGDTYAYALGSAGQVFWQEHWTPAEAGWRQWVGREVLYAGEIFSLNATDVLDMTASGYLLS